MKEDDAQVRKGRSETCGTYGECKKNWRSVNRWLDWRKMTQHIKRNNSCPYNSQCLHWITIPHVRFFTSFNMFSTVIKCQEKNYGTQNNNRAYFYIKQYTINFISLLLNSCMHLMLPKFRNLCLQIIVLHLTGIKLFSGERMYIII